MKKERKIWTMNKRSVLGWISVNFLTLPGCIQRLISVHRLLCGGLGGGSQCGRAVGTSPWSDEQDNCHSLAGDGLWMGYREMDGNGWKWEIRVQVLRSWMIAFCVPRSKKQFSKWSAWPGLWAGTLLGLGALCWDGMIAEKFCSP